jgi:hypothetical protein
MSNEFRIVRGGPEDDEVTVRQPKPPVPARRSRWVGFMRALDSWSGTLAVLCGGTFLVWVVYLVLSQPVSQAAPARYRAPTLDQRLAAAERLARAAVEDGARTRAQLDELRAELANARDLAEMERALQAAQPQPLPLRVTVRAKRRRVAEIRR